MYWNFGQFLWAKRYLLSVFQIHWHKCIFSLEAEAELISADERRDYSALNAVRLLCSDDSEGTIHILRNHIFRGFFLSPPPFLSIFHVLKTSKNCHFLTLFHPKQVLTEYMNGPPKQSVPKDYVESGQNTWSAREKRTL